MCSARPHPALHGVAACSQILPHSPSRHARMLLIRCELNASFMTHTAQARGGNPSEKRALFSLFSMAKWPRSRPIVWPCSGAATVGELAR
eukprot:708380-Prymnesium_polylepis.2